MPPWGLGFEEAMRSLSSLVEGQLERRRSNLERMRALTAELDRTSLPDLSASSSDPTMSSPSTRPPTRTQEEDYRDPREQLPARRTHGGPYGDSVIERVIASYRRE